MKTKNITHLAILLALAAITPAAMAEEGQKEAAKEQKVPAPGSLASVIHDGVTFSILAKAVKAAELEETLSGKGPFTIFAPTDEAFSKLPAGALDKLLLPENKEKLRLLLTYHIVPGQYISSGLKDGDLTTLSGDKVKIDVGGTDKIEIDEAKVASADVIANNGVFHSIDRVNVPKTLDGFAGLDHDD